MINTTSLFSTRDRELPPHPLDLPLPPMLFRDDESLKMPILYNKPQDNYVSSSVLNILKTRLGSTAIKELPYEDNGKITFENLVLHLSKKSDNPIVNQQDDKQIINQQIKILFDMKNEAMNITRSGQTSYSRHIILKYLQDKVNIFDELASIASFNNRPVNRVENDLKIGATRSDNIGNTRFATGGNILEPKKISLTFLYDDNKKIKIKEVEISHKPNTGLGILSEAINDNHDKLHIKASWNVVSTGANVVQAGSISNFIINDVVFGTINDIQKYDRDGRVVAAINNLTSKTGVRGSIDPRGHLVLSSIDGRGITVKGDGADILSLNTNKQNSTTSFSHSNYGKLTLIQNNSDDIKLEDNPEKQYIGFSKEKVEESTINLRKLKYSSYDLQEALSIGVSPNNESLIHKQIQEAKSLTDITYIGSKRILNILDSSILDLQKIRHTLNTNQQTSIYEQGNLDKGLLVSKNA